MSPTTRVRLYGGRTTHAVKPASDGSGYITNCAIYISAGSTNHWMPDTAVVTCRRCPRKTA
ncbi:hypothetical protein [Streptomyces tanashiensis]|uniref:hypothetical protein n=1 Tax=Streptomyces tanashiensis TaxID=67367 RepID=UPI0033CDE0C6